MNSTEGSDPADGLLMPAEDLAVDLPDFGDSSLAPGALDALDQSMQEINAMDWSSDACNIGDIFGNSTSLPRQEIQVEYDDLATHPEAEDTHARADSVFEPGTDGDPPLMSTEFADITHGDIADVFDETLFEDFELPKRQLRPQCRQGQLFGTTWLDNDETGNYDPEKEAEEKRRQERMRRTRAKAIDSVRHACDTGSAESSEGEKPCKSEEVPSLPVTLHFKSQAGKAHFAKKLRDHELELASVQKGYKLRKHANEAQTTSTGCEKLGKVDNSAKPFARGCYACVALYGTSSDQHCSLLDNEKSWPCDTCQDENDCELITPPIRKLACDTCKSHRVACSYNSTRNQGKSCDRCALFSHHCISGPVKAFIRPRIRYERDWEKDSYPQPTRRKNGDVVPPSACEECRIGSRQCQYPQDEDKHFRRACWNCLEESLPCTIRAKDAPRDQNMAVQQPINLVSTHNKPALPPPPPPSQRPPMATRNLITSFAHPIIFNCDDKSQLKKFSTQNEKVKAPCHFCTEPALAFFGFGIANAEVVEFPGISGFMELSNGHRSCSVESTRLCTLCTLHRMSIVMCDKHVMQPIIGAGTLTPEAREQAMDRLLDGKVSQDEAQSYCSLCTNHASYVCAAEMDDEEVPGCGLKLCEPCVLRLQGQHEGDLAEMLQRGSKSGTSEERPLGYRADVELLKDDGALMLHLKELSKQ